MAQAIEVTTGTANVVRDYEAICRVVQLFLDGERDGDAAKLAAAFHPDARMFGAAEGIRYDAPVVELFKIMEAAPAGPTHRTRILSVDQTGDTAVAKVAEEAVWGDNSFVDYLQLAHLGGEWKIVSKLFAHTGGKIPAH